MAFPFSMYSGCILAGNFVSHRESMSRYHKVQYVFEGEFRMEPVNHQVLLAGRGGFYAQSLAQVFRQEGWEVFCLGEKAPALGTDAGAHFCADCGEDLEAEAFFRTHAVSHIIYLLDEGIVRGNLADLQAVLRLGHQFHVRHVFLLSSAEVFPAGGSPRSEDEIPAPETELGKQYYLAEECARNWQRVYGLPVTILRCPDAYGPGQRPEDGWMGQFFSGICEGKPILPAEEDARRDFLWMDDAALAVYRAVARGYEGEFLHISSGSPVSWKEIQALCPEGIQEASEGKEPLKMGFSQAVLDHRRCAKELGWQAKQEWKDGFGKACRAMTDYLAGQGILEEEKKKEQAREWRKTMLLPYAENLAGFLLMVLVAKLQGGFVVDPVIYFDMNYLYIGAMGLLYGKRHSLLACLLASLLLAWILVGRGMDAVGILYVPQHLLHFISYLFAAILAGYFADRREHEREAAQWMDSRHRERYAFLQQMYLENTKIKDRLYRQIIHMDDSIGRLYFLLRKLDSVEVEEVFNQAAVLVSEVMEVPDVAIYVMNRDRRSLRQRVRLGGEKLRNLPSVQMVEDCAYLKSVVEGKSIYANLNLDKSAPDLAAPVIYEDEVLAVIEICGMDFDQWNLNQQNLLAITARIISSSVARACCYEVSEVTHDGTL